MEKKKRTCLKCNRLFNSTGPGNRICKHCSQINARLPRFTEEQLQKQRGVKAITTSRLLDAESLIADTFRQHAWHVRPAPVSAIATVGLKPRQSDAFRLAMQHPITVISGGAGTGKTYVVARLARTFQDAGLDIALCSPTGKAAKRIEESMQLQGLDLEAKTIHRLLEYDAYEVRKQYPHARLHGWELKPYAIQHSRFQEVLFLDADNVPVRDPTYLFDTPQFEDRGTIFWPDFGRLGRDRLAWRVFGDIPYRDEPEVESGQIVLDKARCWPALELCHWYMQNSNNFFFRHVHGDKEVFHLAWRKLGLEYAMPARGIDALPGVMCQHDFENNRVFQHRNMRKWSFHHNPRTPRFQFEDECLRFVDELKGQWSPAAQTLASDDDIAAMVEMDDQTYEYRRVGHDQRPLLFRGDGTFAAGDAGRERYWAIRDGRLLVCGDDGHLTMNLERKPNGSWQGRWLVYEKMPIVLEPKP